MIRVGKFYLTLFFLVLLGFGNAMEMDAAELHVTATIEPSEISEQDAAQLSLAIEGSASAQEPQMPAVDGLEITRVGQSTNVQFINGVMSGGVTYIYRVVPQKAGVFTIPSINVISGNETAKTTPLTLRVLKPSPSYSMPQTPSTSSAPSSSQTPAEEASSEVAMIQLNYPKRDFYVGELVPIDLKVYLHQGLRISQISIPVLSGNAFTVGRLGDKPEQAGQRVSGAPFVVLTWHTTVAAVKVGEHPLGAQMECALLVENRSSRRRSSPFEDGIFDDSFFDRFFGNVQEKRVTLRSKDALVKILPLPEEGKPADFSGAIGQFEISADASPKEVTSGDPITLKMVVKGTGNFDRIKPPELDNQAGFKTYTPSGKFEPEDVAGYLGQKTFEQVVIPQNPTITSIPKIPFSYFDPQSRKYVSLLSKEIPIKVTPAPLSAQGLSTVPTTTPVGGPSVASSSSREAELVANKLELGSVTASFVPVYGRLWFWVIQAIPLAAFLAAWVLGRRRDRLMNDPQFARAWSASRVIRTQLKALDLAMQQRKTADFFKAARRLLQERFGERWGIKAQTLTFAEIEERLANSSEREMMPKGLDQNLLDDIRSIFQVADAVAYSGQQYDAEALMEWKEKVLRALKGLEPKA